LEDLQGTVVDTLSFYTLSSLSTGRSDGSLITERFWSLSNLVVDIIETLEACELDRYEYQLNYSVDIEALEQVLNSSDGDIKVQFTVEGFGSR